MMKFDDYPGSYKEYVAYKQAEESKARIKLDIEKYGENGEPENGEFSRAIWFNSGSKLTYWEWVDASVIKSVASDIIKRIQRS